MSRARCRSVSASISRGTNFAARHGASAEDLDLVEQRRRPAQPDGRSPRRGGAIDRVARAAWRPVERLSGRCADVRSRGRRLSRPARQYSACRKSLDGVVTGIFGFDTRPKRRSRAARSAVAMAGPGGENGVPSTTFAKRYDFPAVQNGATARRVGPDDRHHRARRRFPQTATSKSISTRSASARRT